MQESQKKNYMQKNFSSFLFFFLNIMKKEMSEQKLLIDEKLPCNIVHMYELNGSPKIDLILHAHSLTITISNLNIQIFIPDIIRCAFCKEWNHSKENGESFYFNSQIKKFYFGVFNGKKTRFYYRVYFPAEFNSTERTINITGWQNNNTEIIDL